jgi:ketosteroid isomerase-like protein
MLPPRERGCSIVLRFITPFSVSTRLKREFFMKRYVTLLTLASCITAAALATESTPASAPPAADAKKQVLDLEKEWVAAELKHDATKLQRILDDKFVFSYGSKKAADKAAYIKEFTDGDIDPTESQTLSDESVIVDRDTAVVVGTDTASGTEKGSAYRVVFRYTVTYVHRQGHWLALAEHLVEVPSGK